MGTAGVLLGAWAGRSSGHPKNIMDAGTGSGLIALMLAQRFPVAAVTGAELDAEACAEAAQNFMDSAFTGRLHLIQKDILNDPPDHKYDLVVSNPPFYIDSLDAPAESRRIARNISRGDFRKWTDFLCQSAMPDGEINLVTDIKNTDLLVENMKEKGWFIYEYLKVKHHAGAEPSLLLSSFLTTQAEPICRELLLYEKDGSRTLDHQRLVDDFYLNVQ